MQRFGSQLFMNRVNIGIATLKMAIACTLIADAAMENSLIVEKHPIARTHFESDLEALVLQHTRERVIGGIECRHLLRFGVKRLY